MHEDNEGVDRRALLRRIGTAAGAGALAVTAEGLLSAAPAQATTGTMMYGTTNNAGTDLTILTAASASTATLNVVNTGGSGLYAKASTASGYPASGALIGDANSEGNAGVVGINGTGYGVRGHSGGFGFAGVFGENSGGGVGVLGQINSAAGGFPAVAGDNHGAGPGVTGNSSGAGPGVWGASNGIGVEGQSFAAHGVGVLGVGSGGALALKAEGDAVFIGKASFARSGRIGIAAGSSHATKTSILLSSTSMVLATIQGNVSGVWVQGVTTVAGSAGSFTIHLNKATSASLHVAWFILS